MPSSANHADLASRGIAADEQECMLLWQRGPQFLSCAKTEWPNEEKKMHLSSDDPEMKPEVHAANAEESPNALFEHFSRWTRLIRVIAWVLRFKEACLSARAKKRQKQLILQQTEVQRATEVILGVIQRCEFREEMERLNNCESVRSSSRLASLTPRLRVGLMTTGGRLPPTAAAERYLPILPSKGHVPALIIGHYHRDNSHAGVEQTLAAVRRSFWILKGRSAVKTVLRKCFTCRGSRGAMNKRTL